MLRLLVLCTSTAGMLLAGTAWAQAPTIYGGVSPNMLEPRVALVIGVPAVRPGNGFFKLQSPRQDAAAVTARLRELKFTVFSPGEAYDDDAQLTRQAIKAYIYDFARLLRSTKAVGVVYFSGHGVVDQAGRAYLVPFDAHVDFDRDLSEELIPVSLVYDAFEYAGNVLNVIVIDACRDVPFASLQAFGRPSFNAQEPESEVVYRANATTAGGKAADGGPDGKLSPYATAFIEALDLPDAGLSQVFDKVAARLEQLGVAQKQVIKKVGSRDFIFRPTVVSFNREQLIYNSGGPRSLYENLYKQFAGGYFGHAALEYVKDPVLAPPIGQESVTTKMPLRLQNELSLSLPGPVVPGGSVLRVTGDAKFVGGQSWLPVTSFSGASGYVAQAQTLPLQPQAGLPVEMRFEADSVPGAERLSVDSLATLNKLVAAEHPGRIVSAQIIAQQLSAGIDTTSSPQAVLARQAVVAQLLKAQGIAANRIETRVEPAQATTEDGSIRIQLKVERNP